ncbi:MAG: DUF2062 domain-containing protein [Alphaproteobacteria bacterium]|jgi:hypothetical protein|nr:DUF2062 domain-containing protein [Alphaproteobacteria bacterium]MDP6587951.1 DUF2062 domain-containing protein [Alphaproteobacteria bacterium]MDP6818240.1 DUF2062 domain-containing protein [Alphaproteobacteria bacterium]|tara:strand:+ start:736 stop:1470 length:735 start_codon:yes stop_codon:yes gene_type:complete
MSVFRRRRKRQLLARLLEFVWPRMGWRRAGRYYVFRIKRLPGTPYTIACGFALGAAVSFTPFIGLHFVLAGLLAWVLRANLLASAIGTAVGNPWTFPGIWFGVLWLGSKILGRDMPELSLSDLSLTMIFDHFSTIGVPMIVGGIPAGLVAWVIFYIPIRRAIANYQHHRHTSRIKRQQVLAEQRREREVGVANINIEEEPAGAAETAAETADELTIPEPGKAQEARPSATVTPINRAAGESKRG